MADKFVYANKYLLKSEHMLAKAGYDAVSVSSEPYGKKRLFSA